MIAPNVSGPIAVTRWRERYARTIVDFSPPFLSSIGKQYKNRRGSRGFGLAARSRAHLNSKPGNEKPCAEQKEQL